MTDYDASVQILKDTTKVTRSYNVTATEVNIDCLKGSFLTICGRHINGGYVAFPQWGVSAELSIDDVSYNTSKILLAFKSISNLDFMSDDYWLSKLAEEFAKIITPLLKQ